MTEMTDPALADTPVPDSGPHEVPVVRPAHNARCTASALIAATAVVAALSAWQAWGTHELVHDAAATAAQREAAAGRTAMLQWAWLVGLVVSGAAFAGWLLRARVNSARICAAPQRLRTRWAVASWLVPGLNLWWPRTVLVDLWRASDPDVPPFGADLRSVRSGRLIDVWWATFLLAHAVELLAVVLERTGSVEAVFVAGVAAGGLAVVAAASALYLMRRVDRWQTGREAVRTWSTA